MDKENLKLIEQKINSCTTFGQFLRNIFNISKLKSVEVCKKLNIDRRKIFNLLNDIKPDVSLNLIQDLEKLFNLKIGYLSNKWYYFKTKYTTKQYNNEELINRLGWHILESNPYLTNILNHYRIKENSTEEEKIEFLRQYYGTVDIDEYAKNIAKNLYIIKCKIVEPGRLPFIRFCELFIKENFKEKNKLVLQRFKEYLPKNTIVKLMEALFSNDTDFDEKIKQVSIILKERNIQLIKLPYVEKTFTRALTFSFGQRKYIIITDMYNSDVLILFSLLKEIMTCFSPWLSRKEYYSIFKEYYDIWKKSNKNRKLNMAEDLANSIDKIYSLDNTKPDYYLNVSEVYKSIAKKYKKVKF